MVRRIRRRILLTLIMMAMPMVSAGQNTSSDPATPIDNTIDAAEDEAPLARGFAKWNQYEGPYATLGFGGGYLLDFAAYSQDQNSKEQFQLAPEWKSRDFRVLLRGRLKVLGDTTWSAGIMYDFANDEWVFRQTGLMFSVPTVPGHFFVGRTKEGFSLNKVMIGYGGWGPERSPISDATLPILADGVKWLGYTPKAHLIWNVGVYGDRFSEGQGFSTYDHQISGRLAWVPILKGEGETLLHVGVSLRYGTPKDDTLNLRARPGAWPAPYFLETGKFSATSTVLTGLEIYYRPGRYTFGSEYFFQNVHRSDAANPFFHGGEAFASWFITGETRSYNTQGGYFNIVSPLRSVFSGGRGAWELVGQATYTDLDSQGLTGGRFWRLTPMANWYLSKGVRLEFIYGYGSLDRFGVVGKTQFFQSRLQFQL